MLIRKAYEQMLQWKRGKSTQALLVSGARQIGKTYLINAFAHENYKHVVEFNLIRDEEACESFKNAKNPDDLMLRMSIASTAPIVPRETIIFIDEVQEYPDILTHLKFLVQKDQYDFVLSGSLLGVELENIRSWPVGYLSEITMYPLDFEEFCWANNLNQEAFDICMTCFKDKTEIPDFVHERLLALWHRYLLVGGMPDAVNTYLKANAIDQVRVIQSNIRTLYEKDISKYAPRDRRLVIKEIYNLIPSELIGSKKRFKLNSIQNIKRYTQVENEFLWLTSAGVALPVYNASEPSPPLLISKQSNLFKLFYSDVGLLTSAFLKNVSLDILDGKSNLNNGGIYENAVAQELKAHQFELYYFSSKKNGELDFLIETKDAKVIAFEVKSGRSYKSHAALDNVLRVKNYDISEVYVLAETNLEQVNGVCYLPVYMVALFSNALT